MAEEARRIVGAITVKGRTYVEGQEQELADVLPANDVQRLLKVGVLTGTWTLPPVVQEQGPNSTAPVSNAPVVSDAVQSWPQHDIVTTPDAAVVTSSPAAVVRKKKTAAKKSSHRKR